MENLVVGKHCFRIIGEIGRGGMGVVYHARQEEMNRDVALKTLLNAHDPFARKRFDREVQALASVQHPNLVKVYSYESSSDWLSFAMELIQGETLAATLKVLSRRVKVDSISDATGHKTLDSTVVESDQKDNAAILETVILPKDQFPSSPTRGCDSERSPKISTAYVRNCVQFLRDVASAVQALYEKGIIHRDIKPSNIMIRRDGSPVLMDLGLAKLNAESSLTLSAQFVGTVQYASPEQIQNAADVDFRTDVYSLGMTMWAMLTLRPVNGNCDAMGIHEIMQRIVTQDAPSVRSVYRQVPKELDAIVSKCVKRNRKERYGTVQSLINDLDGYINGQPISVGSWNSSRWLRNWLIQDPIRAAFGLVIVGLLVNNGAKFILLPLMTKGGMSKFQDEVSGGTESLAWLMIGGGVLVWVGNQAMQLWNGRKKQLARGKVSMFLRVALVVAFIAILLIGIETSWMSIKTWLFIFTDRGEFKWRTGK